MKFLWTYGHRIAVITAIYVVAVLATLNFGVVPILDWVQAGPIGIGIGLGVYYTVVFVLTMVATVVMVLWIVKDIGNS